MDRDRAEILAIQALSWAANNLALERFLTASGLELADLRKRASEPELLAAFLDFLLAHEDLAEAFCRASSLEPQSLHAARRALPGAVVED